MKLGLPRDPSMEGVLCPKVDSHSRGGLQQKNPTTHSFNFALYHTKGQPLSLRSDRQRQVSRTLCVSQDLIPSCTRNCILPQQGCMPVIAMGSQVM